MKTRIARNISRLSDVVAQGCIRRMEAGAPSSSLIAFARGNDLIKLSILIAHECLSVRSVSVFLFLCLFPCYLIESRDVDPIEIRERRFAWCGAAARSREE